MRFLIIVSLLLPISLFAQQPVQGQKYVEGSMSFSIQKQENGGETTSFSFNPSLGFMVTDRMAIGGSLGYFSAFSDVFLSFIDPTTGELIFVTQGTRRTSLSVASFVGWFLPVTEQLGLNIETGLGLDYSKYDRDIGTSSERYSLTFQFAPSLYYFVTNKIVLDVSLGGLLFRQGVSKEVDNTTAFNLTLRSNAFFGLRYFWGRE